MGYGRLTVFVLLKFAANRSQNRLSSVSVCVLGYALVMRPRQQFVHREWRLGGGGDYLASIGSKQHRQKVFSRCILFISFIVYIFLLNLASLSSVLIYLYIF